MTRGAVALRAVEALLREVEAGGRFSGVVGVTQGDQELLLDAFGYASRTWSIPATVETRFDSASITKLFTAVATLQLVEEDAFEAIGEKSGNVVGWRRNIYSYPPIGGPDGGAHVTVGDLLRFHRAATDGRLLGPALTLELLSPKVRHSARGAGSHQMGFGFEFETDADDVVRSYGKEGVNVGVSGMLRHYPMQAITVAVLAVGENTAWAPIKAIDEAVGNMRV